MWNFPSVVGYILNRIKFCIFFLTIIFFFPNPISQTTKVLYVMTSAPNEVDVNKADTVTCGSFSADTLNQPAPVAAPGKLAGKGDSCTLDGSAEHHQQQASLPGRQSTVKQPPVCEVVSVDDDVKPDTDSE